MRHHELSRSLCAVHRHERRSRRSTSVMLSARALSGAGVAQLAERQPSKPLGLCAVLSRVPERA
jgi:predicted SpoU family rRNA methylase